MVTLASDSFTRADSSDLGTNWDTVTGELAWRLVSNQAKSPAIDNDGAELYNAATWPNDQWSQGDCVVSANAWSSGDGVGLALRCSPSARTYYRLVVNTNGSSNLEIGKRVAGTYSPLSTRTVTFTNGDTLYVEVQGSTLLIKLNGVQSGTTVSDPSIGSGSAGVSYSGETNAGTNSGTLDNWSGGDFSAGAQDTPELRGTSGLRASNQMRQLLAQ